jgi:hypothetical protein
VEHQLGGDRGGGGGLRVLALGRGSARPRSGSRPGGGTSPRSWTSTPRARHHRGARPAPAFPSGLGLAARRAVTSSAAKRGGGADVTGRGLTSSPATRPWSSRTPCPRSWRSTAGDPTRRRATLAATIRPGPARWTARRPRRRWPLAPGGAVRPIDILFRGPRGRGTHPGKMTEPRAAVLSVLFASGDGLRYVNRG